MLEAVVNTVSKVLAVLDVIFYRGDRRSTLENRMIVVKSAMNSSGESVCVDGERVGV